MRKVFLTNEILLLLFLFSYDSMRFDRFILFEPSDRSNLMRVMMELRSMTFPSTGEYVMARLRASIVSLPTSSSWSTMTDLHTAEAHHQHHLLPKKKKKKRSKTKKKKKKASTVHPVDCTENTGCDNKMMPPALTEDHFPSLGIDSDSNVGWDTTASPVGERAEEEDDDDEDEDNSSQEENDAYSSEESVKQGCLCGAEDERKSTKVPSDGASTATTASSNASSSSSFELMSKKQQILSGYAAALLKDPSVPTRTHNKVVCTVPDAVHESFRVLPISRSLISDDDDNDDVQVKVAPDPVVITSPLTWGEGHTFADILRQK